MKKTKIGQFFIPVKVHFDSKKVFKNASCGSQHRKSHPVAKDKILAWSDCKEAKLEVNNTEEDNKMRVFILKTEKLGFEMWWISLWVYIVILEKVGNE